MSSSSVGANGGYDLNTSARWEAKRLDLSNGLLAHSFWD
ncbi:hypothetical protein M0802_016335 [Mischocyttarus mexicanus]|nr:hypothetical protein M0802_016335 [Mischocyttarus mexicanus]